jgi:hypothetical protein
MGDDQVGFEIVEEAVLEKFRAGDTGPYEIVTMHADGTVSTWRRDGEEI